MKVYLAGTASQRGLLPELERSPAILESFLAFSDWQKPLLKCRDFMLDSGAYTFLAQGRGPADLETYIREYIGFIRENKIERFFELDIDPLIGLEGVRAIRRRIEEETGKPPVPVWHTSRGRAGFEDICRRYDYVAIGGFAIGEIKPDAYPAVRGLIEEAHRSGTKVHGLGFTRFKDLPRMHFDSVDSTSWLWGRFGYYFTFKDGVMKMERGKTDRMRAEKTLTAYNLGVWMRFQEWAENNLRGGEITMTYEVSKRMEIAAAHSLDLPYESRCRSFHGHNWIVTVHVRAESLNPEGMVYDFARLKDEVHGRLDHQYLNDILGMNPTAENIAKWVHDRIPGCYRVDVQESEGNVASYMDRCRDVRREGPRGVPRPGHEVRRGLRDTPRGVRPRGHAVPCPWNPLSDGPMPGMPHSRRHKRLRGDPGAVCREVSHRGDALQEGDRGHARLLARGGRGLGRIPLGGPGMLRVNEIFRSLDGEGPTAGLPSVFVRLQGCDLACPWCDTPYARGADYPGEEVEELSVPEVEETVLSFGCARATLTGGEPLLQKDAPELVKALASSGMEVSVETNGAHNIRPVQRRGSTVVMDWKMPSSGMEERMNTLNLGRLRETDVLKCVIGDMDADMRRVPDLMKRTAAKIYLSPVFGKTEPREIAERMLEEAWDVRLQVQLHKVIWPPDMRGV